MDVIIEDVPRPTARHMDMLRRHLPRSLAVLRRLQFAASFPGGATAHTHVLFSYPRSPPPAAPREQGKDEDEDGDGEDGKRGGCFAAAYVDLSRSPETEAWLFSSLEAAYPSPPGSGFSPPAEVKVKVKAEIEAEEEVKVEAEMEEGAEVELDLVLALLRRVRRLAADLGPDERARFAAVNAGGGRGVMVGSLDEGLRRRLLGRRGVTVSYVNPYQKWLFRPMPAKLGEETGEEVGDEETEDNKRTKKVEMSPLTEDMEWDVVRREDVSLIMSRSWIPRTEATLMLLPSTAVRLRDGTPIAWAFLGPDGSLSSLHCEEAFRGRGIAKAVARRLLRDHVADFTGGDSDDAWGCADVAVDNRQSQGVCASIGGTVGWRNSWTVIDFDSLGDDVPGLVYDIYSLAA